MSDYVPKVGDRVRVVSEGIVEVVGGTGGFRVGPNDCFYGGRGRFTSVVSVEKLPDPEPEWQAGDVVLDADGLVHRFQDTLRGYVWRDSSTGEANEFDIPTRPLTLLVRRGKRVTP